MAFGTSGAAQAIAAATAAIPKLNLSGVPMRNALPGGMPAGQGGGAQPSVGHALAAWLFGGSTPMDDERARIAQGEQQQQALQMRQALLSRLLGSGGGGGQGVPMKADAPQAPPALQPRLDPLKTAAADVTEGLGGDLGSAAPAFGAPPVSVDAPVLPTGIPMKGAAAQPGKVPSLREAADWLLPAAAMGIPGAKEAVDYLDKSGFKGVNVNNRFVDERDAGSAGYYGKEPTAGAEPVYDRNGKEVGWRMADGALQTIEAAKGAEQRGVAAYDLAEIENSDGSKSKVPRLGVVDGFNGVPMRGGSASGVPGSGVTPNRSQTPAERKLAEGRADTTVSREAAAPKAYSGLEAQSRATDLVLEKLDAILGPKGEPEKGLAQGGLGGSTGFNEVMKFIPETKARDLDATLDTIKAVIGFDKLSEMRANSPTGGALGAISDKENKLLQSVMGSLDQGQSSPQFRANLERLREEVAKVRDERKSAYARQYEAPGGARPQFTPAQAAAELARRKAARGQ